MGAPADPPRGAVTAALLLLSVATVLWPDGDAQVASRLRRLRPPRAVPAAGGSDRGAERRPRWGLAGVAGLAAGLLVGGALGLLVAAVAASVVERLLRAAAPDASAEDVAATVRDLPAACDLLGVCLGAGLPVDGALAAVGEAVPGPLGARLTTAAALYRLGAEPRRVWAGVPAELAPLGRVLVRAGESGATVVDGLRTLAAESRTAMRAHTEAAVRRAGVWVLAPLGLCFLPAFVCLGVAPLILGIAGDVFG